MELYEKLLTERYDEEQARGRPLSRFHGVDSAALDRAVQTNPHHVGDLKRLHRFVNKGVGGMGQALRARQISRRFPAAYQEMKREAAGELYVQPKVLE